MEKTIGERIVDVMPFLDRASDAVQPKVQDLVERGGETARYVLDGVWFEAPLHPTLTDVPIGSWTAALVFDGLDLVSGKAAMRNAADSSLAFGIAGAVVAAAVGISDWRYLKGGSRRMGMAHAMLNTAGLTLNTASLLLRATGRRNAGRLAFLAGYSLNGMGAHLGGELSYKYGLRVNRNAFEATGPDDYVPVLDEAELSEEEMRRVEVDGAEVLLSRSEKDGRVCAIAATCNHMGGPLEQGDREGDIVVCPWHKSRFDLCNGKALNGPAVFPQSGYETRVREGKIEVKAVAENIQEKIT
ncbi:MAG TPA: Rieske 2Fe-2S domain-containing protein [Rubrobacter sp.]|nr:Rieske 2Fe-2S domain-containing protein [Rubrobacter sp.]